jgi:DUF1365 family protein
MNSSLYKTTIIHKRFRDFKNQFRYFVLSMFLDHDELIDLAKEIKAFSFNKFNIFSYYEKDHGYRDGRSLRVFVEDFLKLNQIKFQKLKINIMCFPRIFGYVFNPISIIYCYEDQKLLAIFYEVKNTSNEQHTYCFAGNNKGNIDKFKHECDKNFYVSPFIGMKARYKFKNLSPHNKMYVGIDLFDKENNKILTATQYGMKISLNSFILLKELITNPLITIKVIFAILYEATIIIFKGGNYYARDKKIKDSISFEGHL